MSDVVIQVENLGKQYRLGSHLGESYVALRDVLANGARTVGRKLLGRRANSDGKPTGGEGFWALHDVSFQVRRGECVGLIGRNGAGKSTLLKLLSRITEPTTGRISLRGSVASLLEVGTGFHPELTGRENIFLNGAILGMRKSESRHKFDEIVEFAEIEKFIDTPVKRYSSGMYTRLAFSVAAHLEVDILLVDEVLAVGDIQFQKKCLGKMDKVASQGRTVFFVSHNIGMLASLCTSGLYLEQGQLMPPRELQECIDLYGKVAIVTSGEWHGDVGDEHVRLRSATVRSDYADQIYHRGESFDIKFCYEVIKPNEKLVVGVEVYDNKNRCLCLTHLTEELDAAQRVQARSMGKHVGALSVDTSLLSEGHYYIKFDFGIHGRRRIIVDEVTLGFTVLVDRHNGFHQGSFKPNCIVPSWSWTHRTENEYCQPYSAAS